MSEIEALLSAWPVLLIGVLVYLIFYAMGWVGAKLWALKWMWLRKTLKVLSAIKPWVPWAFGGALGVIPVWPHPTFVENLPESYQWWAMMLLGIFAGAFYERIWKSVKHRMDLQGIDINIDDPPRKQ